MSRRRAAALAALFLASLALRPQIIGVGPLLPDIQDDLHEPHAVVGLLGTIPVLCMGLFAPLAPYAAGRVGTRAAIGAAVGLIGCFGLARVLAPGVAALLLLTVPVGIGIAIAGALAPVAVKERFPDRPAFATGIYTTGIQGGSAVSAALAIPLADVFGGWRYALGAFSVTACVLLVAWLVLTSAEPSHVRVARRPPRLPWSSLHAWVLVALFGLMGVCYYGINAWLPDSYIERGWSDRTAGALLAVLNLAQLVSSISIPWLSDRRGGRRPFLIALAVVFQLALLGLVLLPGAGFLWALLVGFTIGAMFPLVLTLPLDMEEQPERVGAVVAMMLGVGYLIAGASPFLLGSVRDATGSFTVGLWLIAGAGALYLASSLALLRTRHEPAA
jgi:MFS transporter, CP family, cyanate transporter